MTYHEHVAGDKHEHPYNGPHSHGGVSALVEPQDDPVATRLCAHAGPHDPHDVPNPNPWRGPNVLFRCPGQPDSQPPNPGACFNCGVPGHYPFDGKHPCGQPDPQPPTSEPRLVDAVNDFILSFRGIDPDHGDHPSGCTFCTMRLAAAQEAADRTPPPSNPESQP